MLRLVHRVSGWRVVRRMLPRRWKRYLAIAALVAMVLRPDLAPQAASWLWEGRVQRGVTVLTDTFTPEAPPSGLG